MDIIIGIIAIVSGAYLGAAMMRLVYKEKLQREYERAKNETLAEVSALNERNSLLEKHLNEIKNERDESLRAKEARLSELQKEISQVKEKNAELQTELRKEKVAYEEKIALLGEAEKKLSDAFKALSADSLKSNNQAFLELAKSALEKFQESAKGDLEKRQIAISEIIKPVKESLEKVNVSIDGIEKSRIDAYARLLEQVKNLHESQNNLKTETSQLVKALRNPVARGRWGEIQLRRVVEIAGMLNYVDFTEQESVDSGRLRPDMIIKLPNNKIIVVDSKTPLDSYLEAISSQDSNEKQGKLAAFADNIRKHISALSAKSYWEQFGGATPDFVVLFLPGEHFFGAALEQDPSLIEKGVQQRVILATPTTLISLLRAVSYGWNQEQLAESANKISKLGGELYDRIFVVLEYIRDLGKSLNKSVESYNSLARSVESRLSATGRKFKELGVQSSKGDLPEITSIDQAASQIPEDTSK